MPKAKSKKGNKAKSSNRRVSKVKVRNSATNSKKRIWKHQGR